ncbi:hypothetical protein IH781_01280 [Patescibacteria group bacterium]|nr:hypothetical protein [Patescibacteria group bacterium]
MQLYIRKMSEDADGKEYFALVDTKSKQPFSNQVTEAKLRERCKEELGCTDEFLDVEIARTRASFEDRQRKISGGAKGATVLADDSSEVLDVGEADSLDDEILSGSNSDVALGPDLGSDTVTE